MNLEPWKKSRNVYPLGVNLEAWETRTQEVETAGKAAVGSASLVPWMAAVWWSM
jgi:hypothetical protein